MVAGIRQLCLNLGCCVWVVVNKTVDKNPDLAVVAEKTEGVPSQRTARPLSGGSEDLADYDRRQLSKENVMVDTYALIRVFTEKGKLLLVQLQK